jgi:uncharacterized membrane protein YjgN (DUF898 family)
MTWLLKELDTNEVLTLKDGFSIGRVNGSRVYSQISNMSKSHCQFRIKEDQLLVRDMESTNGTFVDAERIPSGGEVLLKEGSIVSLGGKKFIVASSVKSQEGRPEAFHPTTSSSNGSSKISQTRSQDKMNFGFQSNNSEMFRILIKNMILTVLTLGLYIPYAKTNLRKFIWSSTSLGKYPFQFTGDPRKLLRARMKLMLFFVGFVICMGAINVLIIKDNKPLTLLMNLSLYAFIGFLVTKARYGAYLYLVNHSRYRSINFNVKRSGSKPFLIESITGFVFTILTLGFYLPFNICNLDRIKWNNTGFGNTSFRYKAKSSEFAILCYKGIFLTIVTLGFYYPWFAVSLHQFKMEHLEFQGARIETNATGGEFFLVLLKSFLLILVTFGLATPFVLTMNLTYFLNNISLHGDYDLDAVYQSAKNDGGDFSDSAASFLDVDSDLDIA